MNKALVIFHDHGSEDILSRFLKAGFKHVFVAIQDGQYWIRIDAQAGMPKFEVVGPKHYDLATFYRGEGYRVVETFRRPNAVPPLIASNCTGMVKAVLGLRSWAITPHQLYQRLVP